MKLEMFDRVLLKTGEKGYIVEVYKDGESYDFEQVPPSSDKLAVWGIKPEDIERRIDIGE